MKTLLPLLPFFFFKLKCWHRCMPNGEHFLFCKICRKLLRCLLSFPGLFPNIKDLMFRVCMLLLVVLTSCMYCGIYFQPFLVCEWSLCKGLSAVYSVDDCRLCFSPIPFQHSSQHLLWLQFLPQPQCPLFTHHHLWRMSRFQRN